MSREQPYEFDQDRPTWLLVRSSKVPGGDGMDGAFAELERCYGLQISFVRVDWETASAARIRRQFSMRKPPSSVITGADGRVHEKFEGSLSTAEMRWKLQDVTGGKP